MGSGVGSGSGSGAGSGSGLGLLALLNLRFFKDDQVLDYEHEPEHTPCSSQCMFPPQLLIEITISVISVDI